MIQRGFPFPFWVFFVLVRQLLFFGYIHLFDWTKPCGPFKLEFCLAFIYSLDNKAYLSSFHQTLWPEFYDKNLPFKKKKKSCVVTQEESDWLIGAMLHLHDPSESKSAGETWTPAQSETRTHGVFRLRLSHCSPALLLFCFSARLTVDSLIQNGLKVARRCVIYAGK